MNTTSVSSLIEQRNAVDAQIREAHYGNFEAYKSRLTELGFELSEPEEFNVFQRVTKTKSHRLVEHVTMAFEYPGSKGC